MMPLQKDKIIKYGTTGETMTTLLLTHPACLKHDTGEHHPETTARLRTVLRHLDRQEFHFLHRDQAPRFFDDDKLDLLRRRQIRAVEHVDRVLERLYDTVPEGTWITITSDHGELFGEEGYFGHGPILHDKVLEVPFVEGLLR